MLHRQQCPPHLDCHSDNCSPKHEFWIRRTLYILTPGPINWTGHTAHVNHCSIRRKSSVSLSIFTVLNCYSSSNFVSILWYSPLLEMLRAASPCSCFIFYGVNWLARGILDEVYSLYIWWFWPINGFGLQFFLLLLLPDLNGWPTWLHLNSLSPYDDICLICTQRFFFFRNFVKIRKIKSLREYSVADSLKCFLNRQKSRGFELVSPDLEALLLWVAKSK